MITKPLVRHLPGGPTLVLPKRNTSMKRTLKVQRGDGRFTFIEWLGMVRCMKQVPEQISYERIVDQYRDLGLPTHLAQSDTDFTIFNLSELHQPLPLRFPVSRLNFFVFAFIRQGQGQYVIDDQTHPIRPRTAYFTNPGHLRSVEYVGIQDVYVITLTESFLKETIAAALFDEFPFLLAETIPAKVLTEPVFAQFETLCRQIEQEYRSTSPFRRRLMGTLLLTLLLKLKEHIWLDYNPIYEGNRHSQIVRAFKRLLEQHYRQLAQGQTERLFRVQEYADAQHLHPAYLSQVIKLKTGKAIGTWITEKTVAEAKALLQHSTLPIKEIAFRLGFTDVAHFGNYFKKHAQASPAAYRLAH